MAKSKLPPLQVALSTERAAAFAVRQGAAELLLRLGPTLSLDEAAGLLKYCRLRGVKAVLDLSAPHTDKQLLISAEALKRLYASGLDAALVGTLGVMRMARQEAPDLPLHWAGIQTEDGVLLAQMSRCERGVLAPGLSRTVIQQLFSRRRGLPLQIPVFSAGCLALPGTPCYLGQYPAQPGASCGFACQQKFGYDGKADTRPLYLRDISLLSHLQELAPLEAAAYGLDWPMDTPEQAGLMVRTVREIWEEPGHIESAVPLLEAAFHRPEGTDSLFTASKGKLCDPEPPAAAVQRHRALDSLLMDMENGLERQCVPVRFAFQMQAGAESRLAVDDYLGHTVFVGGPNPVNNSGQFLSEAEWETRMYKITGTPFLCQNAKARVSPGYTIPPSIFENMKEAVLQKLEQARLALPERGAGRFNPGVRFLPRREEPAVNVQLARMDQLSKELVALRPHCLYLPLWEAAQQPTKVKLALSGKSIIVVELPRVIPPEEREETRALLKVVRTMGITQALVHHPDQMAFTAAQGFHLRTDFATLNSAELRDLRQMRVKSATLSQGMSLRQVKELSHVMDTELTLYGRLPLLHSRACLIYQNRRRCNCEGLNELTDSEGRHLPLTRDAGHSTLVLDSAKLWMLPEKAKWKRIGLWAIRLSMTTENAREVLLVTEAHQGGSRFEPNFMSTGYFLGE